MPSSRQDLSSDVESTPASTSPVSHIVDLSVAVAATGPIGIPAVEVGGREGPEPTRFGDWEKRGRCIDF